MKLIRSAGEVTCAFRDSAFENDVAKTSLAWHCIAKIQGL